MLYEKRSILMELVSPNNYVAIDEEEMMHLDGGLSLHKDGVMLQ